MKRIDYSKLLATLAGRYLFPRNKFCTLCGRKVYDFLPFRGGSAAAPSVIRALGMVGSNLDQFECPWCGGHDRERHLFLYIEKSGIFHDVALKSVLHFAPEVRLSEYIASLGPAHYVRCDLFPATPDVLRVDMLAMPFAANSFDLLIANHVMEHVADDMMAISEISRVLKPGGFAILQTPYSAKLKVTWSDSGIDTDDGRLNIYGQEDHVRVFGRDIFDRFASCGLESKVQSHNNLLTGFDGAYFGVNEEEPFFLFSKPAVQGLPKLGR